MYLVSLHLWFDFDLSTFKFIIFFVCLFFFFLSFLSFFFFSFLFYFKAEKWYRQCCTGGSGSDGPASWPHFAQCLYFKSNQITGIFRWGIRFKNYNNIPHLKLPTIYKYASKPDYHNVPGIVLWVLCRGGGGSTQLWVGYGCAALSSNYHPITKPEKMHICDLCLNHLFHEGPFFKTNQYFLTM